MIKKRAITWRIAGLVVALTAFGGGSAQAAAPTRTSACSSPSYEFSQPFGSLNDSNWYTLAPGQGAGGFTGQGWTLSGGAYIATETLPDGTTETVLDLPPGASAVSPAMCVDSAYPTARMELRDVAGPPVLHLDVAYTSTPSWEKPQGAGSVPGKSAWGVSPPVQLHPGNLFGWQLAQYTFTAGNKSEAQIYDFYVDPRGMV